MSGKYTLIYADPPWAYRDKAADGDRGAGFKYPVMNYGYLPAACVGTGCQRLPSGYVVGTDSAD